MFQDDFEDLVLPMILGLRPSQIERIRPRKQEMKMCEMKELWDRAQKLLQHRLRDS